MKKLDIQMLPIAIALAFLATWALFAFPRGSYAAPRENPPAPVIAASSGFCSYVVRRGDALYMIAARFGTTTAYLAALNNLYNPNYIYAGMVLRVPCAQPIPYPQPQPKPYPWPGPFPICTYYTVQRGDWLKTIAGKFGVSWQAIAQANALYNPNYIYVGQKLAIPCAQPYPPAPPPFPPPYGPTIYPPPCCPTPVYPTPFLPLLNIVEIKDNFYQPAVITVKIGSYVQWINKGSSPHTVTQGLCPGGVCSPTPGGFHSGVLMPGQTYAFQFNQLGTFAYYCQIHGAGMTGSVAVVP